MSRAKRVIAWFVYGLVAIVIVIASANLFVVMVAYKSIKSDIGELNMAKIALVLGTSKSTSYGSENLFFKDRMQAAADLYQKGVVKHIIVSGDNRSKYYNEPQDMLEALEELGIPANAITLDYAGLRTLDSVVRCKEIFDQDDIIIVTQKFHAYRALFIADHYNIKAQAYSANFESKTFAKLLLREVIARPLAVADLYILNKSPKYLGDKETLNIGK